MGKKIIIVGGVAGGATAAARMRRISESCEIVLFEKGKYISYANCGLPYYIGGVITDRQKLFVQTPEVFGSRFNVDVRTQSEVLSIDRTNRTVKVRTTDDREYEERYDELLLTPGSVPVRPPFPGIDTKGIFTLRNVTDTDHIHDFIETNHPTDAVVIGGGFIGLEMAENLTMKGIHVNIVEMLNQVMGPIDYSMASFVHTELREKGVRLFLEHGVASFTPENGRIKVFFKDGQSIMTDMVLLSIGVKPESTLARNAGLKLGARGGVVVDKYLQTEDEHIYAIGDVIEYPHPLTGKPWHCYLAGPANRQARIVADNMIEGNKVEYEGSIGTSIAKVFDLSVGTTGLSAKSLKADNVPFEETVIHPNSYAGYYPDSRSMTLKIVFDKATGKLYGAQAVGYVGIDKRIDQIAAVIKRHGTIYDLQQTEQAYAPPFSSAKDPIALAGYVAGNICCDKMKPLYWQELAEADTSKVTLIDVRSKIEYELGSLPGAINIPLDEFRQHIGELSHDKPVWLFCAVGLRGYLASNILRMNGFDDVRNLIGGLKLYRSCTDKPTDAPEHRPAQTTSVAAADVMKAIRLDACGLTCPGPIMKMKKAVDTLSADQILEVCATDKGFPRDARAWCDSTGNTFIDEQNNNGIYRVHIQKGRGCPVKESKEVEPTGCHEAKNKTLIMFSDDLDKALATFVLANGAAATGGKVSIFFTFWGLNLLKKAHKPAVRKDLFGKMFGWMMPADSRKLGLSKMNFCGIGAKMMRHVMKLRKVDSVEVMRQAALDNGVEFIACQMSMDVMGIHREEMIDEVTVGGVATYMNRAEAANVNLFI